MFSGHLSSIILWSRFKFWFWLICLSLSTSFLFCPTLVYVEVIVGFSEVTFSFPRNCFVKEFPLKPILAVIVLWSEIKLKKIVVYSCFSNDFSPMIWSSWLYWFVVISLRKFFFSFPHNKTRVKRLEMTGCSKKWFVNSHCN